MALTILDTTLRDGSYAINFQFTAIDTTVICQELEKAGILMIEVGHGIGLGASVKGMGGAAETDEAYMDAAQSALKTAQWGMFCIPGIATLEQVKVAASHGMKFIRIGTDVTSVEISQPFIALAKDLGMHVSANFMKSYAAPPDFFARQAALSASYGTDIVYIVDSAGSMLTDELERYFLETQKLTKVDLGFHGHNNLGLAVANSVRAVELGATIIDTSLQGMGRSAGNTPTDIFPFVLERKGIQCKVDPLMLLDAGQKYIAPLLNRHQYDDVDIVCGYAGFHSSYMAVIKEYSFKYKIDPRRLIMGLCQKDRVNAPRALVDKIAHQISQESEEIFTARFQLGRYYGSEQISK